MILFDFVRDALYLFGFALYFIHPRNCCCPCHRGWWKVHEANPSPPPNSWLWWCDIIRTRVERWILKHSQQSPKRTILPFFFAIQKICKLRESNQTELQHSSSGRQNMINLLPKTENDKHEGLYICKSWRRQSNQGCLDYEDYDFCWQSLNGVWTGWRGHKKVLSLMLNFGSHSWLC